MDIRVASIVLVGLLVGAAGQRYGIAGAALALPVGLKLSLLMEILIARLRLQESVTRRRP
jgi:hypothetical protein